MVSSLSTDRERMVVTKNLRYMSNAMGTCLIRITKTGSLGSNRHVDFQSCQPNEGIGKAK